MRHATVCITIGIKVGLDQRSKSRKLKSRSGEFSGALIDLLGVFTSEEIRTQRRQVLHHRGYPCGYPPAPAP